LFTLSSVKEMPWSSSRPYPNWIGAAWVPLAKADVSRTPLLVTGNPFTDVARSPGETPVADRAVILSRIADRIMQNLGTTRQPRTWDNAKHLRQTLAADIPLADHLRYFADDVGVQEGSLSQIDDDTTAHLYRAALGAEATSNKSTDHLILHDTTIQISEGATI
jgi:aldehyde dehydrogenase